ncbi:carboxymuconolactone decarboxylase family protein [Roseomonas sp. HJA6]|uniref:Carboxymuconolactone decarboxylase family protein n=1 Tax=Roseomonas alba TaxID=2846776 RepID=A0ABS7A994_9PROT|nr:carboxymuconolactone decarboxylase family protein [Neoroseomonas alba]MBW6397895.1 carboxymuconolactone decarboxylase family protein [Neoroseomonas alba]
MARIAYADPAQPDLRAAAETIRNSRKKIGHLHRMLLHAPPIAEGWIAMFDAVRWNSTLSGKIRELMMCRVAAINDATYEWEAHAPIALQEGATQAQLDTLHDWQASDAFDATERAALAYCDAMTLSVHVPESVAAEVRALFPERQLVELTVTIAGYNCVSRVLEALAIKGTDALPDA